MPIQAYSWDLLRSVIKLGKLGRGWVMFLAFASTVSSFLAPTGALIVTLCYYISVAAAATFSDFHLDHCNALMQLMLQESL